MRLLILLVVAALSSSAQVVPYVQSLVERGDLADAQLLASRFRQQYGNTPEALAAFSWIARGELQARHYELAMQQAREVEQQVRASLALRKLDSDPYTPMALGAAFEVEAQVLAAQGRRTEALHLLQTEEREFQQTSIAARLQKNVLLLTLVGHPLPEIRGAAGSWRGKPVLVFFWAHWCPDCKADAPILAKLAVEFEPKGLVVVGPTKLYGYTAQEDSATPSDEKRFIEQVFDRYYAQIPKMLRTSDPSNFDRFGVSTTPTLVLADARGIVRLYHPGFMDEKSLREALLQVVGEH